MTDKRKTAIMTDTNSGLSPTDGAKLGIYVLPMPVLIDGDTYYEGKNLDTATLFERQAENRLCSTSQPSPGEVLEMWDQILQDGYEQLVYIPMSSGLSNSCDTAACLAADYDGRVVVVNNHQISVTLKQSVLNALEMAKEGWDAARIQAELEKASFQTSIYISVDSLEHLKKGGRISAGAAALGIALNLKPVLTIQGEKLDAYKKCRGMKKCMSEMLDGIRKDWETRFSDWPLDEVSIGVASTFLDPADKEAWQAMAQAYFPEVSVYYDDLPCSIGCHLGAGSPGLGISRKWKKPQ
jgi:DegV family protein with EDD domain